MRDVCKRLADLPTPEETRTANGITFHIYHRDGGTQVFWEDGDIVCVLASHLPSEEVIQLAFAKAMKAFRRVVDEGRDAGDQHRSVARVSAWRMPCRQGSATGSSLRTAPSGISVVA